MYNILVIINNIFLIYVLHILFINNFCTCAILLDYLKSIEVILMITCSTLSFINISSCCHTFCCVSRRLYWTCVFYCYQWLVIVLCDSDD